MTSKHAWRRSPPLAEQYYKVLSSMIRTVLSSRSPLLAEQYSNSRQPTVTNILVSAFISMIIWIYSCPLSTVRFHLNIRCFTLCEWLEQSLQRPKEISTKTNANLQHCWRHCSWQWQWKTIMLGDNLNNSWCLRKLRTQCLKVSFRKAALPPKCWFLKDLPT